MQRRIAGRAKEERDGGIGVYQKKSPAFFREKNGYAPEVVIAGSADAKMVILFVWAVHA